MNLHVCINLSYLHKYLCIHEKCICYSCALISDIFPVKEAKLPEQALSRIESCLKDIQFWIHHNMLKLNADKTEVMLFSSRHNSKNSKPSS